MARTSATGYRCHRTAGRMAAQHACSAGGRTWHAEPLRGRPLCTVCRALQRATSSTQEAARRKSCRRMRSSPCRHQVMPPDAPSGLETRPISAEEFPAFLKVLFDAFGDDFRDDECEIESLVFEPERSLAVFDEDAIVGTAAIFSRELTVPGAVTPVAAVTMVGVAPTHRRRGLLTSLMGRQLTELHENEREPVAALWASEAGIYGRFGYGPAARGARLTTRTPRLRMRPGTDRGTGRIRRVELDHARADLRAVYEQLRPTTVGWLNRNGSWWDYRLWDPEHRRRGATALRAAVYEEPEGRVTGYVVYSIKSDWAVSEPNNEVRIRELAAATPEAHAATWGFVAELDLVRGLTARNRPLDEPLQHLLAD